MRLFDCSTAPSPRRVRFFAAEKNMELELVPVDLGSGQQFSADFRAVNPDCVVPALQLDNGACISEVVAICQYLEEIQPEPTLFGDTALERATAAMWNGKVEQQGLWAVADAYRNFSRGFKGHALPGPDKYEQIPELVERSKSRVLSFFRTLESRLAQNEFLAGDRFTIADITAVVMVDFAARVKIVIDDDARNLQRWYASVSARPGASA
jgi:glutathione S-transferase